MEQITKQMNIEKVIQKYPETLEVFMKHGFHCLGCAAASFEDIESGALAHNIDVDKLIKELNEAIKKK